MKVFLIAMVCLGCALANPYYNILEEEIPKEVEVVIIESNIIMNQQEVAAEVLWNALSHYEGNVLISQALAQGFIYLEPSCIWSVNINSELTYHNSKLGRTGYVLMRGTKNGVSKYYQVFSSPQNGNFTCTVPYP